MVKSSLRSIVTSRWSRLVISAALLALLLYETNVEEIRAAIARAQLSWILLAYGAVMASQFVSAYRWGLLARAVGFAASFGRICIYYLSAMYLNLFGPGTVAGDVGRVLFLAGGRRRGLALSTVFADRTIGFVALVWIAAAGVLLLPGDPLLQPLRWPAALIVPVTIAGWLWGPRFLARLLPPTSRWRRLVEHDMAPYWHDHTLLAISLAWAAGAHLCQIIGQMFIARALGLELPWTFFFLVVPLVNIAGAAPLSLQGVGLREASYLYYLAKIGVPRESALAVGLLTSIVIIASGVSGLPAFLMLRQSGTDQERKVEGGKRKDQIG
jgi:uncharacterized membrane protein YbhN (UPF0104 family)